MFRLLLYYGSRRRPIGSRVPLSHNRPQSINSGMESGTQSIEFFRPWRNKNVLSPQPCKLRRNKYRSCLHQSGKHYANSDRPCHDIRDHCKWSCPAGQVPNSDCLELEIILSSKLQDLHRYYRRSGLWALAGLQLAFGRDMALVIWKSSDSLFAIG